MEFANIYILFLILLLPVIFWLAKALRRRKSSSFTYSSGEIISDIKPSFRVRLSRNIILIRMGVLFFIIVALARPRDPIDETKVYVEGVNIVIAIDTSGSMQAMDFELKGQRKDRLTVVKEVVGKFIEERENDRIGIVAFSSEAYSVCPLTLDHSWLLANLDRVEIGMMEDGTSIGSAIMASLNRIKDADSKDKVIILLTDGVNNSGKISPIDAALAAKTLGVKIYAIGAGTKGLAPFPMEDMFGNKILRPIEVEIDEKLLKEIADTTAGKYFRATDTKSLIEVYEEIDNLEKVKIEEVGYLKYNELFDKFLFIAIFLLLAEIIVSNFVLRRIP